MCNDPKIRIVWTDDFLKVVPSFYFKYRKNVFRGGVFLNKENFIDMKYYHEILNSELSQTIQLVPCHKCAGCCAEWSQQWTARCMLESRRFKKNCYVTFTYNDENLPENGQLCQRDFQLFMKRLRKYCFSHDLPSPRYFYCGEYGTENNRPHYHAILFNYLPSDLKFFYYGKGKIKKKTYFKGAKAYYLSKELQDIWSVYKNELQEDGTFKRVLKPIGHVLISEVSYPDIKYVANYQLKFSKNYDFHEIKPFNRQSSRPALARTYYDENFYSIIANETLPKGLQLRVKRIKYFDKLLQRDYSEYYIPLLEKRISIAKAVEYDTDLPYFEYLKVRENRMQRQMLSKHRD